MLSGKRSGVTREGSISVSAGLRSDRGQPGALYPGGRNPHSSVVRVAGGNQDGSTVGGLDNAGGGARHRGVGLRDAHRPVARFGALRCSVRTFPHRLDCDQYNVSGVQILTSLKAPVDSILVSAPAITLNRSFLYI